MATDDLLPPSPASDQPGLPPHAPDELLVQFAPGIAGQLRAELARALGAEEQEAIHTQAMQAAGHGVLSVFRLPPGLDLDQAMEILAKRPGVVSVDRNWTLGLDATAEPGADATSNDPAFDGGSLWGMYGDATTPANRFGTGAGEAWAAGHTGATTAVAGVIDTGIDYRHPDLYLNIWLNQGEITATLKAALKDINADGLITFRDLNAAENAALVSDLNANGRIDAGDLLADARWENGVDEDGNGYRDDLIGWDFVNGDNDPLDDNRHGTHVSGTIAGMGGNGTGVAGVAWDAQLVALKFLGSSGSGSASNAIKAVDYFTAASTAAGASANFVATNNSWGGGGYSTAMRDAIERGANQDILFMAAAGNSSTNLDGTSYYPAEYDTTFNGGLDAVISVASITSTGGLSSFSNYGGASVDLAAPGSSIYSTLPNGAYGSLSGTSMATPHVAGAALLYAASNPGASAAEIRAAILGTTEATTSLVGKTITGGRLDVGELLGVAAPPPPPPGTATLSIAATASADAIEGSSGSKAFGFVVTRAGDTAGAASASWTVAQGTTTASDFAGPLSGTVSFAAGETSRTISILVAADTVVEPDETFSVALSGASGAVIGTGSATGRIRNDDTATAPPPVTDVPVPAGQPSALEQYMIELVQATRASVGAQPIVWNGDLGDAAQKHTDWMFTNRTLSHTGSGGSSPYQRMAAEGYDFSGTAISGENVAMRAGTGRGLDQANVKALFDQFMGSSGHRANMQRDSFEEIGIGLQGNTTNSWVTQDFAGTSRRGPFLTGVAFDDRDGDRTYDAGEGLGGVSLSIKNLSTGALTTTTTMAAGGWQTGNMAAGSYELTFSGGGLATAVVRTATVGTRNVKVDIDVDAPGAVLMAAEEPVADGPGRGGRRQDAMLATFEGPWSDDPSEGLQPAPASLGNDLVFG